MASGADFWVSTHRSICCQCLIFFSRFWKYLWYRWFALLESVLKQRKGTLVFQFSVRQWRSSCIQSMLIWRSQFSCLHLIHRCKAEISTSIDFAWSHRHMHVLLMLNQISTFYTTFTNLNSPVSFFYLCRIPMCTDVFTAILSMFQSIFSYAC